MSSTVLCTPVEYLPAMLLIGFAISAAITLVKGRISYQEACKAKIRSGKWTTAPGYGLDYLMGNFVNILTGAVAAAVVPGWVYTLVEAEPSLGGCIIIGILVAVSVGVMGAKFFAEMVDSFHNTKKIKSLESAAMRPVQAPKPPVQ